MTCDKTPERRGGIWALPGGLRPLTSLDEMNILQRWGSLSYLAFPFVGKERLLVFLSGVVM